MPMPSTTTYLSERSARTPKHAQPSPSQSLERRVESLALELMVRADQNMTTNNSTEPSGESEREGRLSLFARILVYAAILILLGVLIYYLGFSAGAFIGDELSQ